MEAVISIPELLDNVFANMSRLENVATAGVSKLWLEVSRNHIWWEVDSPCEIFRLLVPLKVDDEVGTHLHEFARFPAAKDWDAFKPYARRVRILRDSYNEEPHKSVRHLIHAMMRSPSRPAVIFPNLRHLDWTIQPDKTWEDGLEALLHPLVKRADIFVELEATRTFYPLAQYFQDLLVITPQLTRLSIIASGLSNTVDIIDALSSFLPNVLTLAEVQLPQPLLTPALLSKLSRLPVLSRVLPGLNVHWEPPGFDPSDATDFKMEVVLEQDAFPSLQDIHLALSVPSAIRLLANPNFPATNLRDIRVRVLDTYTNEDAYALLQTIGRRCPYLSRLVIFLYPPDSNGRLDSNIDIASQSLDAATLAPLKVLSQLKDLYIYHIVPAALSEEDLFSVVDHLPHLENLSIVARPGFVPGPSPHPPPTFGWSTLRRFANRFPRFENLTLYIDLSVDCDDHEIMLHAVDTHHTFKSLAALNVGTSPPPKEKVAAAWRLCAILSTDSDLVGGITPPTFWGVPPLVHADSKFVESMKDEWAEVEKLVRLGLSVKAGKLRADCLPYLTS